MRRIAGEKIPALAQGQPTGDTKLPADVQTFAKILGAVTQGHDTTFSAEDLDCMATVGDPVKATEAAVAPKRRRRGSGPSPGQSAGWRFTPTACCRC